MGDGFFLALKEKFIITMHMRSAHVSNKLKWCLVYKTERETDIEKHHSPLQNR